jgi:glycosyltransferase involved in cell wall biosynthesis
MTIHFVTALPVYNEAKTVDSVLDEVVKHSSNILVVDDGSTDGTAGLLAKRNDIVVVTHNPNQGYGAALNTAFRYAIDQEYEYLVTIDCDGQHEPQCIQEFVNACAQEKLDIVSGSRYLMTFAGDSEPPAERKWINQQITRELNESLRLGITDAFCGFKAYRVAALRKLRITEFGYAMPLEVWVQAACHKLRIKELPVRLLYLDDKRSFGPTLDDAAVRLNYYHRVLDRCFAALPDDCPKLKAERQH